MTSEPRDLGDIQIGTPVHGFDGTLLGYVREVQPNYLLVHEEGQHGDHQIPVHAIEGFDGERVQVSVGQRSVTDVDDEETVRRSDEQPK